MQFDSPEAFAENEARNPFIDADDPINMLWANGILFRSSTFYPTDSISKEYLAGILHIDHVVFTKMDKYKKQLKLSREKGPTVNIIDMSKHSVFNELTKFLKIKFYQ